MWPSKLEKDKIYIGMRLAYMMDGEMLSRKVLDIKNDKFFLSKPWKDMKDSKYNDDNNEFGSEEDIETIQALLCQNRSDLPY